MSTQTEIFRRLVREHVGSAPVFVSSGANVSDLVERMTDEQASCAIVCDLEGNIQGIITEQDVTRRIACRVPPVTPVESVMTSPVISVQNSDYLFHAIAFMRRKRLRHIPVVDEKNTVCGMLALHDALAFLSERAMELIDRLTHEESVEGLKKVRQAQVELADSLFADNVPVPEVQSLLTDINIDIHGRIVRRTVSDMASDGWGEPPVPFSLIIMGSGGRGENFLFPDQDNGFILADYPDSEHSRMDTFFVELAERMTKMLDQVGFPLCRGNIMATNPVWRKTLNQWRNQIKIWMTRRNEVALRSCDIFFDFRHAFGDPDLSESLRDFVTSAAAKNPGFIKDMFSIEAEHKVALGFFGGLMSERDRDGQPGMINLKYGGTLPLVEAIRLLALKNGIAKTSTLQRIRALHENNVLNANTQDYLIGAFQYITRLLLRQQIADFREGREVGNFVSKKNLTKRETDYLIACFKAVQDFRGALKSELSGEGF